MTPGVKELASDDVTVNISSAVKCEERELANDVLKMKDSTCSERTNTVRTPLLRLSQAIVGAVEGACGFWGLQVARRPLMATLVSVLLVAVLGSGLIRLNLVFRPYDLWVPEGSEFSKVSAWKLANFPALYREQVAVWEGDNVLTAASVRQMWGFRTQVERIRGHLGENISVSWSDVCVKVPVEKLTDAIQGSMEEPKACYESSLLELWGRNEGDILQNLTDEDVIETLNSANISRAYGTPRDFIQSLGAIYRDEKGRILGARSAMHTWLTLIDQEAIARQECEVDVATGEKVDLRGVTWEKALAALAQKYQGSLNGPNNLRLNLRAAHTLGYVLHSSLTGDAVWIGVGWTVLLIYVVLTMGLPCGRGHRVVPACVGLLAIGMAVLSSYGACALIGIPFGTLNNVLPVLLVALGVDDMYVIVTAWDSCGPSGGDVELRAERAMGRAGMAITVTSITDVLAFLVGTTTTLPGLRWFCIYAAVGILMVFLLQGTLFVAAMVTNERWNSQRPGASQGQALCFPLEIASKEWLPRVDIRQAMTRWGEWLLRPVSKCVVCALTAALFAFAVFSMTLLEHEFNTMWLIPEGSQLQQWFRTVEQQFPQMHERGVVFFAGAQFPDDFPALRRLSKELRALPEVHDVDAWFEELDLEDAFERHRWLRFLSPRRQCQLLLKNIGLARRRHFRVDFDLESDLEEEKADAGLPHPCSTFQIEFQYLPPPTFHLKQASMRRIRQMVRDTHVNGYRAAWAHVHAQWETDGVILEDLLRSLCVVLVAVGLVSLVLLASVRAAFFVLICVVGSLASVVSVARLWGLSLNTVTGIAFVLGVGICVDYATHIAHDFLFSHGTRAERVLNALHRMGAAVFHGGASTFITFLLLAPSDNYISSSYFKILISVSFFGLFHALVFLPVVLSLLGPDSHINGQGLNLTKAEERKEETTLPKGVLPSYTINLPPSFSSPPYILSPTSCPPLYRKSNTLPNLAIFLSDGDSSSRETSSTLNSYSRSSSEGSLKHSTWCTKL